MRLAKFPLHLASSLASKSFLALLLLTPAAFAGGPRFVTGSTFASAGKIITFGTSTPSYFTDPAPLSSSVSHQQADAMVATAAAVWSTPYANIVLAQGGNLAEHVSSANSYMGPGGPVFPADVEATNAQQKPIAIIYDTDGSIIELLLGQGASAPASCRLNGVIESVDAFGYQGTIDHALIVINGRCATSASQPLLQLQYQLTRVFGRVLGLAWSQLNDNVFTGVTTPTANQVANWPLMHPIDVICGPYTYQCMQNPFALREDDISALALLYPVTTANALPGKIPSFTNAIGLEGLVTFPSGEGMEQVNVTVLRQYGGTSYQQPWQVASAVTGVTYTQDAGNPITGPPATNVGGGDTWRQGAFSTGRVLVGSDANLTIVTEPINPLYTGSYAIAPYVRQPVTPSGSPVSVPGNSEQPGGWLDFRITANDAATATVPANDGTETSPTATDPTGLWASNFAAPQHTAWRSVSIHAQRTWTVETTATDETGVATTNKAQPVIGIWQSTDPTGTLPTVAASPGAMNALTLGTTQLRLAATTADSSYRLAFADQFGSGRPDFSYTARLLYADALTPTTVGNNGGQLTLTGMGFRPNSRVLINGVFAKVTSTTATTIVVLAPARTAAGSPTQPVDVTVLDPATNGSTTLLAALTYSTAASDTITITAAPTALETGIPAQPAFTVQVFLPNGTPAANASVLFSVTSGASTLGCGTACTLTTNANGVAMTTLTGTAPGSVTVTATEISGGAFVTLTLTDTNPRRAITLSGGPHYLAAGAGAAYVFAATATQDNAPAASTPITWSATATSGPAPALSATSTTTAADGTSSITAQVNSIQANAIDTITSCAWSTICASGNIYGIDPANITLTLTGGGGQSVTSTAPLAPVTISVTDPAGHPVEAASVTIHQAVYAWEGPCPAEGRCPAAPVLLTSTTTGVSGSSGTLPITPLTVPGVPQVVQVTVTSGPQGSLTITLLKTP